MRLSSITIALIVAVVAVTVGVTVTGELQPGELCTDRYGSNYSALGNETLRDQHNAIAVCEAPNGSHHPIRLKNASSEVTHASA